MRGRREVGRVKRKIKKKRKEWRRGERVGYEWKRERLAKGEEAIGKRGGNENG